MMRTACCPLLAWKSASDIAPLLLLASVVSATSASADGSAWADFWTSSQNQALQIHGFASLAGVKTSANRFYGNSEDGSLDAIEIGINASYQFSPRLMLSGQVIARQAGNMYDGSPSLDYGLIDLTLHEAAVHRLGVRLGRLKNPLGLYNETRDVPFTRPSIFLPQAVYFDKARNLLLSTDGVMFYTDLASTHGNYSLILGTGQAVTDGNLEWVFLGDDSPGKLGSDGLSWVGSFWYSTPEERLRLGLSAVDTTLKYDPGGTRDALWPGETNLTYLILSGQYNTEFWTISTEYSRLPTRYGGYGPSMPFSDLDSEGWYLQAAYRLRPDLEALLRYESGVADRSSRDGRILSEQTRGTIPRFDFYHHAWTAGLTWTPNKHLMLRAQYSRNNGTYILSPRENDPADLVKDWNLFALQFALRF